MASDGGGKFTWCHAGDFSDGGLPGIEVELFGFFAVSGFALGFAFHPVHLLRGGFMTVGVDIALELVVDTPFDLTRPLRQGINYVTADAVDGAGIRVFAGAPVNAEPCGQFGFEADTERTRECPLVQDQVAGIQRQESFRGRFPHFRRNHRMNMNVRVTGS